MVTTPGRRGPLRGSAHRLPTAGGRVRPPAEVVEASKPPPVPRHLGPAARKVWRTVMATMPLSLPELDALSVSRFAELVEERDQVMAAWREHGPLLEEPIVSPKGDVVGTRYVPNPAAQMLRQLDRQLDALADRLALTPAARGRLGLVLTSAERQAAEVDRVMSGLEVRR